jgi:hypothetical protein
MEHTRRSKRALKRALMNISSLRNTHNNSVNVMNNGKLPNANECNGNANKRLERKHFEWRESEHRNKYVTERLKGRELERRKG